VGEISAGRRKCMCKALRWKSTCEYEEARKIFNFRKSEIEAWCEM
jgi:hypothetical protein